MNEAPAGDDDEDKTLVRPAGFVARSSLSFHTLPEGTRLRDHEITGLIGEGGFGIVYLAYDHSLQRRVAIKEYMPSAIASRANASTVVAVKSERHLDTFRAGLKSFVNEARLLARFDHPSLVKVYRFWEQNGTAYMVMPYYEGPTLKRALADMGRPPDEAELSQWLRPLLDALAVMHAAHCFHRDIAPDNILLTASGPLLLDFGAARRVIGDMTHALTVVLKPGFAPIEQYGEVSTMAQGAWTDLYALASVVYAAVTGHAPMSSVERLMDDRLEPLSGLAAGRYSVPFLAAIDAALSLRPHDRPQDVAAFRRLMDGRAAPAVPPPVFVAIVSAPPQRVLAQPTPQRFHDSPPSPRPPEPTAPTLLAAPPPPPPPPLSTSLPPAPAPGTRPARPPVALDGHTARRHRKATGYAISAVIGVAVLGAVGYFTSKTRPPASAEAPAPTVPVSTVPAVAAPATNVPAVAAEEAAAVPAERAPVVTPPAEAAVTRPAEAAVSNPASAPVARSAPSSVSRPASASVKKPAPAAEARPRTPPPEAPTRPDAERPAATANPSVTGARCSDILQKASLEPLTAGEAAYLKRECR